MDVREKLDAFSFFDGAILGHGFTDYMRDYDIVAEVDGSGNREGPGRYRYRFTHCVQASYATNLRDDTWRKSWSDAYTGATYWDQNGEPEGYDSFVFLWGVRWAGAYPGLIYLEDSTAASDWSQRLGRLMHEITIETNVYSLRLVFHDVVITKLGNEAPILDKVNIPVEP
jgi:hypothetical protein